MTDDNLELSNKLQQLFIKHRSLYSEWIDCIKVFIEAGCDLNHARTMKDITEITRLSAITDKEGPRQMQLQDEILDTELEIRNHLDRLQAINGSTSPELIHMTVPLCLICGTIHEPEYPHALTHKFNQEIRRKHKRDAQPSDTWAHCVGIMRESAIAANQLKQGDHGADA
jgi:hypothetical protein